MATLYPKELTAIPTPLGAVLLVEAAGDGIVAARFARKAVKAGPPPKNPALREAAAQVRAYFRKRLNRFDLPLHFEGTQLQIEVWRMVATLEFGEIASYSDVARILGRPRAHRGVAAAMCKTPIDLFVPAHRVVGADGSVRGAGPNSMRRRLLSFEGIVLR